VLEFKLLLTLIAVNGIPVVLHLCLGDRFSRPIDGGVLLTDGYPLFGSSKTWRGLLFGSIGAAIIAILFGFSLGFAIAFAVLSLLGDLLSSFIKRRMKLVPGSRSIGLDQIPEALLPLIAGVYWLDYGLTTIVIVTLSFCILNILSSPVLALFAIRKHPH